MLVDSLLTFTGASGQAITSATTTASTDSIDIGPLISVGSLGANLVRDIGVGAAVYLVVVLTTGSVTTVTSPTLTVNVQGDDNTGFSSPTTYASSVTVNLPTTTAAAAAGSTLIAMRLPSAAYERYLRLSFVTGGTITTASYTFQAFLTADADQVRYYSDAITIS